MRRITVKTEHCLDLQNNYNNQNKCMLQMVVLLRSGDLKYYYVEGRLYVTKSICTFSKYGVSNNYF